MKRRQVTLKEIAKRLDISKSTVSRALSGADDVSPGTRKRVLDTAREMDYQPNITALNLMKGRTNTIGVVIPAFTIPFYARVISSIQNEMLKSGYNVMVCQSNENHEQEVKNIDILIRSGVDGIALSMARDTRGFNHLLKLKKKGIPLILFNRVVKDMGFSTVTVNDLEGARMATNYLVKNGRKRIVFIGGPEGILLARMRRQGYEQILVENGFQVNRDLMFEGDFTYEAGVSFTEVLLRRKIPFDAVFCVCDQVAYGVMDVLKRNRLAIPEQVSVMGFTNETVSSITSPPLTTISQPMDEIGVKVAETLLDHIHHATMDFVPVQVEFDPFLLVRGSA